MTALLGPVAADLRVGKRGLSRAQHDVLVETGLLEGEPVELLEGVLAEVVPQGHEHASVVKELTHRLVPRRARGEHPRSAALVVEVAAWGHLPLAGDSQRTDLAHEAPVRAAAGGEQYRVLDPPAREVVVHTQPGAAGCATVRRLPGGTTRSRGRTAPLSVLGVDVPLADLLGGA